MNNRRGKQPPRTPERDEVEDLRPQEESVPTRTDFPLPEDFARPPEGDTASTVQIPAQEEEPQTGTGERKHTLGEAEVACDPDEETRTEIRILTREIENETDTGTGTGTGEHAEQPAAAESQPLFDPDAETGTDPDAEDAESGDVEGDSTLTEWGDPFAGVDEAASTRSRFPAATDHEPEADFTRTEMDGMLGPPPASEQPAPSARTPLLDAPTGERTEAEPEPEPEEEPEPERPAPRPNRARRRIRKRRPARLAPWIAALGRKLDPRGPLQACRAFCRELPGRWIAGARRPRIEIKINRTAQWWRRTITEISVLYAIVVPIEMVLNGGRIGAFGVHPHPYWLIVLPMAGARGVVAGLLAAGIGSVLYVLGAIQALGTGDMAQLFTYQHMLEPILFFGVGFFSGELHDELALRYRKLQMHLDEVQERVQRLRQERDVLAKANHELERRIVDESVQFSNLIVAATRIERSGRSEVFEIALDMVEEHCGAAASVLMLLDDGTLDYLCHRGWPEEEVGKRLAAARASDFVRRAIEEGRHIDGFSPGEKAPEEGPLVVAPLFFSGGVVKALLCLDAVPPARLSESTVTLFFGITDWVSAALARLVRGAEMPARPKAITPSVQTDAYLGSNVELGLRLRLEVERCTRYGVPTSFLAIQAVQCRDSSPEGAETVDRYIQMHFTGGLRPSDEIFRFGYPGCFLLVLAGTTVEGAEVVRTRLLRRVDYSPSREVGSIEIFASGPDAEAPDLLSLTERVATRFRERSALPLEAACPIRVPAAIEIGGIPEFLRRLRMETSLATRNGFDLHVVGIHASGPAAAGPDLLARHVHAAGVRVLRSTDGVFGIGSGQCAVVLPCTDSEQAATVAHRLVTAVRARDSDTPYGDLETQVLSLGTSHPDATSFLRALAGKGPK